MITVSMSKDRYRPLVQLLPPLHPHPLSLSLRELSVVFRRQASCASSEKVEAYLPPIVIGSDVIEKVVGLALEVLVGAWAEGEFDCGFHLSVHIRVILVGHSVQSLSCVKLRVSWQRVTSPQGRYQIFTPLL